MDKIKNSLEELLPIKTIAVSNSNDAMQLIKKYSYLFSAYVLDIEMVGQEFSGIQLAETIRSQPKGALVPIIFLTSYSHFGGGGLQNLHYYDFFKKPFDPQRIAASLRSALSLEDNTSASKKNTTFLIESNHLFFELDLSTVSCIEIWGSQLLVTDLIGQTTTYRVKPNTFSKICTHLQSSSQHSLCQIHRSVIINVNRIRKIEWRKNSATVWLFNVDDWKPVGKTYLDKLEVYNK